MRLRSQRARRKASAAIDSKAQHLQDILSDRSRLDIFRGLARFDLTDYEKVKARVTAEQLKFFVVQYLARFPARRYALRRMGLWHSLRPRSESPSPTRSKRPPRR